MWKIFVACALLAPACVDLRDFQGQWSGPAVGQDAPLLVGFPSGEQASLTLTSLADDSMAGELSTSSGVLANASVIPLASAESDVLGDITFAGDPARVFVSFVTTSDGNGDALVLTAFFVEKRVELRVLRGAPVPLYGVFDLTR